MKVIKLTLLAFDHNNRSVEEITQLIQNTDLTYVKVIKSEDRGSIFSGSTYGPVTTEEQNKHLIKSILRDI